MEIKNLKINDITYQVKFHFLKGKESVLLLHFGGGSLEMWSAMIPYLIDEYQLIIPDLRGHGHSDSPSEGYHIDNMANDLSNILESSQIEKVHVIGASLGAEVGLSFAKNYSDKILSLICDGAYYNENGIYSINKLNEDDWSKYKDERINEAKNFKRPRFNSKTELIESIKEKYNQYGWGWNENFEKEAFYNCQDIDGKWITGWTERARYGYYKHYFDYNFEKYYENIQCPILLVPGDDEVQNEEITQIYTEFKNLSKNCSIKHVEGSIHPISWMTIPEKMSKEAILFFKSLNK
ncbi:MAG: alpha/beta hydrolase [Candidatus Lokiarchaeota archaeon]|nr:alpha/beta hydrolase [Candidatus Lokiarchaeota archaeon]